MSHVLEQKAIGQHYVNQATKYEHWDFVYQRWGRAYFLGNATKYICRARRKNGQEDYFKAKNYLIKLMELEPEAQHTEVFARGMGHLPQRMGEVEELARVYELSSLEGVLLSLLGGIMDPDRSTLEYCVSLLNVLIDTLAGPSANVPIAATGQMRG